MHAGMPDRPRGEKTQMKAQAKNQTDELDFFGIKSEISAIARKSGALVSGVAAADAFDIAPEGRRPTDLLPRAKSVFVMGGAQPRAGDWQSPNYQHMEVTTTSDRIQGLALKLARIIEDNYGNYAVCIPPGVDYGQQAFMSISMAADLSGCGSSSLAGPVLHPEYGFMWYDFPFVRFAQLYHKKTMTNCDISIYETKNGKTARNLTPNECDYDMKDFFPLKTIEIKHYYQDKTYKIKVPANPDKVLKTNYGDNYMIPDRVCDEECENCAPRKADKEEV